jgi:predicted type IV restriction endonuclease
LFKFLKESDDNELRETLAEAFAWYTNSSKKYEIVKALNEQLKIEKDLKVKNEIIRTINRLQD